MGAKALEPFAPREVLPGPAVSTREDLIRAVGDIATTIFHPAGTCRMGSDEAAVVDNSLGGARVVGPARGGRLDHAEDRLRQSPVQGPLELPASFDTSQRNRPLDKTRMLHVTR